MEQNEAGKGSNLLKKFAELFTPDEVEMFVIFREAYLKAVRRKNELFENESIEEEFEYEGDTYIFEISSTRVDRRGGRKFNLNLKKPGLDLQQKKYQESSLGGEVVATREMYAKRQRKEVDGREQWVVGQMSLTADGYEGRGLAKALIILGNEAVVDVMADLCGWRKAGAGVTALITPQLAGESIQSQQNLKWTESIGKLAIKLGYIQQEDGLAKRFEFDKA